MLSAEIYPYTCKCTTFIVLFLKYLGDDSEKTPTIKGFKLSKNILVHSKTESTLLKCGKHYLCFSVYNQSKLNAPLFKQ